MAKTNPDSRAHGKKQDDFASQAAGPAPGFFREYLDFLRYNKKWWLTPILLALLILGALVVLGGSTAAPFIYTLF